MDFNEYQKLAMTTRNKDINQKDMLINSVMGLNGAAGYYEYLKGVRHGWDLNAVPNLKLGER